MLKQESSVVRFFTPIVILSILTLFQFTYQPVNYLIFGILFLISLRSKYWQLMAVMFIMMVKYTHEPLDERVMKYDLVTWILFACYFFLSIKSIVQYFSKKDSILLSLSLFLFVVVFLSIFSQIPQMSLLKIVGFVWGIFTCYVLVRESEHPLYEFLFGVLAFYVVAGTISFSYPEISVKEWTTLHQGITRHPQYYATLLSPLIALSVIRYLKGFREKKQTAMSLFLLFFGMVQLFYTYSRTGMFSSFLAVAVTIVIMMYRERQRSIFLKVLLILTLLLIPVLMKYDELTQAVSLIMTKEIKHEDAFDYSPEQFGIEDVVETRQGLIDFSYENFQEHPIVGIGFGVPSEIAYLKIASDDLFNIPLSAPIEKGNIFSTVLEENGLIGFFFFLIFLFTLLRRIFSADYPDIALMVSAFLVNMGEMAFFSTNGPGPYIWLMMFSGLRVPKMKTENIDNDHLIRRGE